jgi:hypothetical protein
MMKTRLIAAAAMATTLIAVPAIAQDVPHRAAVTPHANDVTARSLRYHDSGFWPGDVAAGVVGGALGTAGAIASAPFRAFDDSYAYYDGYAGYPYDGEYGYRVSRNDLSGRVCAPGSRLRGEDGRLYRCQ